MALAISVSLISFLYIYLFTFQLLTQLRTSLPRVLLSLSLRSAALTTGLYKGVNPSTGHSELILHVMLHGLGCNVGEGVVSLLHVC